MSEGAVTRQTRVVVLAGGLSHERDVSLRSGRRVAEALREAGSRSTCATSTPPAPAAARRPPDCVLPLLHGETGEDGAMREVLELRRRCPTSAPGPSACRAAFDKPVAKAVVARAGLPRPPASRCRTRRSASSAPPP